MNNLADLLDYRSKILLSIHNFKGKTNTMNSWISVSWGHIYYSFTDTKTFNQEDANIRGVRNKGKSL